MFSGPFSATFCPNLGPYGYQNLGHIFSGPFEIFCRIFGHLATVVAALYCAVRLLIHGNYWYVGLSVCGKLYSRQSCPMPLDC